MITLHLDSLAFTTANVLRDLEVLTGHAASEVHIVGGGVNNELLNELIGEATARLWFAAQ